MSLCLLAWPPGAQTLLPHRLAGPLGCSGWFSLELWPEGDRVLPARRGLVPPALGLGWELTHQLSRVPALLTRSQDSISVSVRGGDPDCNLLGEVHRHTCCGLISLGPDE